MAAAPLSSAARRFAHTASRIVTREVSGSHKLTIDGYRQSTKIPRTWEETSQAFEAAGYSWRIQYSPNGYRCAESGDDYISLYLQLLHADHLENTQPLQFSFTLLDQAGNPLPKYSRSKQCIFAKEESSFKNSRCIGFHDFIKQKDLEESGCIKDDCFTVKCDISVTRDWPEGTSPVTVPPSDLHKHLNNLLWEKQGTDVAFEVGGETFHAHRWLLAARSPVFKAVIASAIKDNKSSSTKIPGIEPKVFKAMLHFMYTDSLPDDMLLEEQDNTFVQNLIAAAQRYELERLKLMCEEALCKRIDASTVAAILAVAEQHNCHDLKTACVEFIGRPGNLRVIMETQGFKKIKANCPDVLMELVMKQLA